jgi:hypothetical protein
VRFVGLVAGMFPPPNMSHGFVSFTLPSRPHVYLQRGSVSQSVYIRQRRHYSTLLGPEKLVRVGAVK